MSPAAWWVIHFRRTRLRKEFGMKKSLWMGLASVVVMSAMALPTMAQAGGGGGGGGGRGGRQGGRGNFDPAQFQQQQLDQIKTALNASDDEWKVLQAKIQKVMTLQQELNAGRGRGGFGGRGGRRGGGGGGAPAGDNSNPIAAASSELSNSVQNTGTSAEDLKAKMTALRDAKKKVQGELTTAQDDLKGVVTVRQEAVLVSMGYLD
jgi:peptidoglycan hydrolase CwlO-like protein